MRILVIGNCMSYGIAQCLELMTEAEVIPELSHSINTIKQDVRDFDWVFSATLEIGLEEKFPEIANKVLYYPRAIFQPLFPDCVYATANGSFIQTPMSDYNSSIILAGWKSGLQQSEIVSLFRADVFNSLGFFSGVSAAWRNLTWEETERAIGTQDIVEKWKKNPNFMHTLNHPQLFVIADITRKLALKANLDIKVRYPEKFLHDYLIDGAVWPVYPEIAEKFGMEGSYEFRTPNPRKNSRGGPVVLNLETYVSESLAAYEGIDSNTVYCERLLQPAYGDITAYLKTAPSASSRHPYSNLPDRQFWKRSVASKAVADVDPVGPRTISISKTDKVATAGSCFAQHISRSLSRSGFTYFVPENGDALQNYGVYSCRYGNLYTARQLLQLFDRAYGTLVTAEHAWARRDGRFADPFRPEIEPDGFASEEAMLTDRQAHLSQVRRMFEQMDVFVFTLGLTEAWKSTNSGEIFPLAPGVTAGDFDPSLYGFVNFTAEEVIQDLVQFVERLKLVNPTARIVLTVSPVPLAATYEDQHVLTSTTFSKSALRVAADVISRRYDHVFYFPSYEIITGCYNRGAYYEDDLRNIKSEGVSHVMKLFLQHCTDDDDQYSGELQSLEAVICEEEKLDQ